MSMTYTVGDFFVFTARFFIKFFFKKSVCLFNAFNKFFAAGSAPVKHFKSFMKMSFYADIFFGKFIEKLKRFIRSKNIIKKLFGLSFKKADFTMKLRCFSERS